MRERHEAARSAATVMPHECEDQCAIDLDCFHPLSSPIALLLSDLSLGCVDEPLDFDFPHVAPLPIVECVTQRQGDAGALLSSGAVVAHGHDDADLVEDDDFCMI